MTITDLAGDLDLAATLTQLARQVRDAQRDTGDAVTATAGRDPLDVLMNGETVEGQDAVVATIRATLAAPHADAVWIAPAGHLLPVTAIGHEQLPLRVLVEDAEAGGPTVGVPMRATATIPGREVLIIDAETLLFPHRGDDGEPSLVVAREPRLALVLQAVFESLWAGAVPAHQVGAVRTALDNTLRRNIVRLLAGGATDEAISRRLGISKRTCARQVAHILACSGASSRFQAGVMLARSGVDIPA